MIRDGIPATVQDLCREMGHCGQRHDATLENDRFVLFVSLDHLMSAIFNKYISSDAKQTITCTTLIAAPTTSTTSIAATNDDNAVSSSIVVDILSKMTRDQQQ